MTTQNVNLETENPVTSKELAVLVPILFRTKPRQSVMIWGDSGIGKTELSDQLALAEMRRKIDFRINIREPVDLRGIPVPDLALMITRWLTPGELPKSDGSDGPTLLVLDEINTGTMQMMAAAMQLVLEGAVGEYKAPENCAILAMGNRSKDSRAVVQMPKPLKNRFSHWTMVVDHDAWVEHCKRTGLPAEIIAFIRFRPEFLSRQPAGEENAYASPRTIYRCGPYIDERPAHRVKLFMSMVGKEVGDEMESFVSMYKSLANIDDILKHPTTAKLPSERSELYAVSTALGRLADHKTFPNVITYAKRLGELNREYEVLTVTDAVQRDANLANVSAYSKWAVDNADITVQHLSA
jgi:hypothetical protein